MDTAKIIAIIIISIILGTLYYINMTYQNKNINNCSFSANKLTDLLAFLAGFILMYLGIVKYDDLIITIIGIIIIVEHIWQLFHHKM